MPICGFGELAEAFLAVVVVEVVHGIHHHDSGHHPQYHSLSRHLTTHSQQFNVVLLLNGFNMSATRLAVARAFLGEAF